MTDAVRDLLTEAQRLLNQAITSLDSATAPASEQGNASVLPTVAILEPVTYDPASDPPPYSARPQGPDRTNMDMTNIVMFASVYAINRRQHRGADLPEQRKIAQAAGYTDGRAWNAWYKSLVTRDEDGRRWITKDGHDWLTTWASNLNLVLPKDLSCWNPQ